MVNVNYNDEKSAIYLTNIKGWVDINNRYYGDNKDSEHLARYSSCTHLTCGCGKTYPKGYNNCDDCLAIKELEKYNKLKFKEYDGSVVYSTSHDTYFYDSDELEDYIYDNDIEDPSTLMLVFCDDLYIEKVNFDDIFDELPEDVTIPKKLQEAFDNVNNIISELKPIGYVNNKIRTTYIKKEE